MMRAVCARRPTRALHHLGYWFTASTSFANPAVTIARALSDTFAGIAPGGVAAFIVAQLLGMLAAVMLGRWLWKAPADSPSPP
jgi:glycerol uptake facilitator-like aquaporin